MRRNPAILLPLAVLALFLCACAWMDLGALAAGQPSPTAPPPPTSTPSPSPTVTLTATATRRPTRTPAPTRDRTATFEAVATESFRMVKEILDPELEKLGVDSSEGELAWIEPGPVRLNLTGYMEHEDEWLTGAGSLYDFVLQTRVQWDTSGALSLCGVTFRAERDRKNGEQNKFFMMRLQFDPGWAVWHWKNDAFDYSLSQGWWSTRDIHDKNGSYNIISLVARGENIDIFLNGDQQSRVLDPKSGAGMLALSANQESGSTECVFEQTWIWTLDR